MGARYNLVRHLVLIAMLLSATFAYCVPSAGPSTDLVFKAGGDELRSVIPFGYSLEDPSGKLTLDDVKSGRAGVFRPASEKTFFGYTHTVVWLRVKVDFSEFHKNHFYFYKEFQHYGRLTVFYPEADGYHSETNDWALPHAGRHIAARPILFSLPVNSSEPQTYFIRYEPDGNLLKVALLWASEKGVLEDVSAEQTAQWLALGGLIALIGYNFFLYTIIRSQYYAFYIYYLTCLTIVLADISGQLSLLIPDAEHYGRLCGWLVLGSQHGASLFTQAFFHTKKYAPRIHKYLGLCDLALLGIAILFFFLPAPKAYSIAPFLTIFLVPAIIAAAWIRWRQGFLPAGYFLVGWLMFGWTLAAYCLEVVGLLPVARFDSRKMFYGALWEATWFSFALAYRVRSSERALRIENKNKEAALEDATAAKISAQTSLEEAKQATRDKGLFLSMVSHELKSPLQSIITVLATEDSRARGRERRDSLKRIGRAVKNIEAQIKDLFVLSVGENVALEMRPETFEVGDLIDTVVEDLADQAASKGLAIQVNRQSKRLFVATDPKRVEQILLNLMENAIKYTRAGGVELSYALESDTSLRISVADTGVGIPEEHLNKIFVPYRRFGLLDREHNSMGIGLSVVQTLLKHLGGKCDVQSIPGVGSTFSVTIPVAVEREVEHEDDDDDAVSILIVDDREEMLRDLAEVAGTLGYQVETATSAPQAANLLAVAGFDVVLIDLEMPVKNGYELASEIRRSGGPNAQTALIAISAGRFNVGNSDSTEGLWPFDAFEQKPLDARAMQRIVESRARRAEAPGPQ